MKQKVYRQQQLQKQRSWSLLCVGYLLLRLEPVLECGWYTQDIVLDKMDFPFASSIQLQITSG